MSFSPEAVEAGLKHLRLADPVMRRLVEQVGPFSLRLDRNRFQALVRSIIAQQISGSAARSISLRLRRMLAPRPVAAKHLARLSPEQCRSAGLSPQKTAYLRDLSQKVLAGEVRFRTMARLADEEIISELTQIKGIGVWTAQMFLMFSLGRLDVFPHQDLGIRMALRNLYQLKDLPDKETSHKIAQPWRPYATIASWYCWRSIDLAKLQKKKTPPPP
jgi:DNA-3-methyladenine glycosylase II